MPDKKTKEMKPSNEEKSRFFAQYYDQKILTTSISRTVLSGGWIERVYNDDCDAEIELKPLSSISDEDAVDVAKLLMEDPRPDVGKSQCMHWKIYWHNIPLTCVDYLRSKGYALPWNGHTVEQMISYSWIKLKE